MGENTRAAQDIIVEMAKSSAEGTISPLDTRLRPDGEKAPLTCSMRAFERYYRTRAQLWELQALTRARPLCGSLGTEFLELAQKAWGAAGQRQDLFLQIEAMRERIRRDRGSGSDVLDFKTGRGGMIEAEFLVQGLQMRAGVWNPQFMFAVEDLKRAGLIAPDDAGALQGSYHFLRRCESILRRWENKSVSSVPRNELEQERLTRRLGLKDLKTFGENYRAAREAIHAIYARYLIR